MDRAAYDRPRTARPATSRPPYQARPDRPRTDRPTSARPDSRSETRPDRSGDRRPDSSRPGPGAPTRSDPRSAPRPGPGSDHDHDHDHDHKNLRPDGSSGPDLRPLRDADDVRPDPDMDVDSLDRDTLRELNSLGPVGTRVGKHLLTAAAVVDDDPDEALRQLRAAVQRGSRLPVVRETAGVVGYAAGDFAFALRELRTATRLGVGSHLLPLIVDCERALGREDRALELAGEARALDPDTTLELAIVVSGIHRDRGDAAAALQALTVPAAAGPRTPGGIRLRYARAEALAAGDRTEEAAALFGEVARDDVDGLTDAADRVADGEGLSFDDLTDDEVDDDPTDDEPGATGDDGPAGVRETANDGVDDLPNTSDDEAAVTGRADEVAAVGDRPAGRDDHGTEGDARRRDAREVSGADPEADADDLAGDNAGEPGQPAGTEHDAAADAGGDGAGRDDRVDDAPAGAPADHGVEGDSPSVAVGGAESGSSAVEVVPASTGGPSATDSPAAGVVGGPEGTEDRQDVGEDGPAGADRPSAGRGSGGAGSGPVGSDSS